LRETTFEVVLIKRVVGVIIDVLGPTHQH
jgi:hypothetical protein